jgi:hypothetical protein
MAIISALNSETNFRQAVGPEVMEQSVVSVVAVVRPLDTPATFDKLGAFMAHSACILTTTEGAFVNIEYMWGGMIYISLCPTYKPGSMYFDYRHFHFKHIDVNPQTPNSPVTVREFANSMNQLMWHKPFAVLTHNCHNAVYLTMRKYGMKTRNPEANERNMFFQGFVDYYGPVYPEP